MEQLHSNPVDWIGTEHLGFVVNTTFSKQNIEVVMAWLEGLQSVIPNGVYAMKADGLHITTVDWIAPLFDYDGVDKRQLFNKLYRSYDEAFCRITANEQPFDVHFTELRVTPGTIILVGQDSGQFQSLRSQFVDSVILPEGGKQPPNIIHSSLARFVAPAIDLTPVQEYAASHPLNITQRINGFQLVETRREPMQDFTVTNRYGLGAG